MTQGKTGRVRGRIVVVARDDAATIADCLDAIAAQRPPDVEVFVVDQDSSDRSADVAIRHPVVDRVVPVVAGSLQIVLDAASGETPALVLVGADRKPDPGWVDAAFAGLARSDVVHGPDRSTRNLGIDLATLRVVRLFAGGASFDEVVERAALAGVCVAETAAMTVGDADVVGPRLGPLPSATPVEAARWQGTISVVLCTRDRPEQLRRCLQSLAALEDGEHELLVIDNHTDPAVEASDLPPGARLVHEPEPGLDAARNRGATEATGDVVAYIDDDCEADPHWLSGLRRAFADDAVGMVTGRVRPASLERPSHRYFEAYFGFDRGLGRRRFTPWDDRPWYPLWTGLLGTGCNMALRRTLLLDVGGFDERFDVGSTIGGGGDLELFARVLRQGTVAEYAPDALVWHHHRDDAGALARQFRGYGQASGAYLAKVVMEQPGMRGQAMRCYVDRVTRRARVARSIRGGTHLLPMRLLATDLYGHLSGPYLYLRAGREARRR